MSFAGSQTTSTVFNYPSPSPYPSTTTTNAVTQTVSVGASPNPFGSAGAGDFHSVETDASALVTHSTTTDAWLGLSGQNLVEYGYKTADDSGDSLSAQFSVPAIQDEYPEANGAAWTNSPAGTFIEKDADATSSTRTYAANGTYTETTTNSRMGTTTSITENPDGSGSINANGLYLGGFVDSIAVSAPASSQISITINYDQPATPTPAPTGQPSPTPGPTIPPLVYTAPAWYGTGTPVLYSQSTTVKTGIAYPASCSVPATYGTSGNELVQTTTRLDTVLGYTDTQTQTTYTNTQYGPVCVVLSDVQNDYYDYQDDFADANGFHFHFPGTALSTATVSETLTLQAGAVVHAARTTQSHGALSISQARVAAAAASLQLRMQRSRHQRLMHLLHFLKSHAVKESR
jgi:hypothetical protein